MNDNPREGRSGWPQGSTGRARLAVLVLLGSILVPLVTAGLRSVLWVLVGLAGSALAAMGVWWALAHTGAVKALGVVLSVGAPVTVLALYATSGMLWAACLSLALWVLAVALARTALAPGPSVVEQPVAKAPQQPWILMNPRSGGGKVGRFRLVEKARAAHCRVSSSTDTRTSPHWRSRPSTREPTCWRWRAVTAPRHSWPRSPRATTCRSW